MLTVTSGEIRGQLRHLEALSATLMVSHCVCERNTSLPGGWLRWYIYQRVCKPPTVTHQLGKDCKNIRELCSWRNAQNGTGSNAKLRRGGSAGVGGGRKRHLRRVGRVMPLPHKDVHTLVLESESSRFRDKGKRGLQRQPRLLGVGRWSWLIQRHSMYL